MDRNIARDVLLRIGKMKVGESILIEDLKNEFPNVDFDKFLTIISWFAIRYYIRIDGRYAHDCQTIERYNKIIGLEREGMEAIDYIKNEKIWNKLEKCLSENGYEDFSIFNSVGLAKEMIKKEFEALLNK